MADSENENQIPVSTAIPAKINNRNYCDTYLWYDRVSHILFLSFIPRDVLSHEYDLSSFNIFYSKKMWSHFYDYVVPVTIYVPPSCHAMKYNYSKIKFKINNTFIKNTDLYFYITSIT